MPRVARNVFAGVPHHVTQRGNRRENVFFSDDDRRFYMDWLGRYCRKHDVEILAYCLMPNHVHLVLVPKHEDGLERALKPLHMRYAQRVNRKRGWSGHLWQGRFFSSALDDAHLWAALGYVERNPVRARMVRKAEIYRWSSAAAHCGLRGDALLTKSPYWAKQLGAVNDWPAWLAARDDANQLDRLRRHANKGLPCGADAFIRRLEQIAGRRLECRPQGRPGKNTGDAHKKG
jgi:putative transposase